MNELARVRFGRVLAAASVCVVLTSVATPASAMPAPGEGASASSAASRGVHAMATDTPSPWVTIGLGGMCLGAYGSRVTWLACEGDTTTTGRQIWQFSDPEGPRSIGASGTLSLLNWATRTYLKNPGASATSDKVPTMATAAEGGSALTWIWSTNSISDFTGRGEFALYGRGGCETPSAGRHRQLFSVLDHGRYATGPNVAAWSPYMHLSSLGATLPNACSTVEFNVDSMTNGQKLRWWDASAAVRSAQAAADAPKHIIGAPLVMTNNLPMIRNQQGALVTPMRISGLAWDSPSLGLRKSILSGGSQIPANRPIRIWLDITSGVARTWRTVGPYQVNSYCSASSTGYLVPKLPELPERFKITVSTSPRCGLSLTLSPW